MDDPLVESDPPVLTRRHGFDVQNLSEEVGQRIVATLGIDALGCHYFNPAVTVSCLQPTPEFFATVRKEQARWCRQASRMIPRSVRRRVKAWVSHEQISDRRTRNLDRSLSFTGVLFIDGRLVAPHEWPRSLGSPR